LLRRLAHQVPASGNACLLGTKVLADLLKGFFLQGLGTNKLRLIGSGFALACKVAQVVGVITRRIRLFVLRGLQ
jgi:hypothetical protein